MAPRGGEEPHASTGRVNVRARLSTGDALLWRDTKLGDARREERLSSPLPRARSRLRMNADSSAATSGTSCAGEGGGTTTGGCGCGCVAGAAFGSESSSACACTGCVGAAVKHPRPVTGQSNRKERRAA